MPGALLNGTSLLFREVIQKWGDLQPLNLQSALNSSLSPQYPISHQSPEPLDAKTQLKWPAATGPLALWQHQSGVATAPALLLLPDRVTQLPQAELFGVGTFLKLQGPVLSLANSGGGKKWGGEQGGGEGGGL